MTQYLRVNYVILFEMVQPKCSGRWGNSKMLAAVENVIIVVFFYFDVCLEFITMES